MMVQKRRKKGSTGGVTDRKDVHVAFVKPQEIILYCVATRMFVRQSILEDLEGIVTDLDEEIKDTKQGAYRFSGSSLSGSITTFKTKDVAVSGSFVVDHSTGYRCWFLWENQLIFLGKPL